MKSKFYLPEELFKSMLSKLNLYNLHTIDCIENKFYLL